MEPNGGGLHPAVEKQWLGMMMMAENDDDGGYDDG